jgi:hypothetical protein
MHFIYYLTAFLNLIMETIGKICFAQIFLQISWHSVWFKGRVTRHQKSTFWWALTILTIFSDLFVKKIQRKFLLASMKSLTNCLFPRCSKATILTMKTLTETSLCFQICIIPEAARYTYCNFIGLQKIFKWWPNPFKAVCKMYLVSIFQSRHDLF